MSSVKDILLRTAEFLRERGVDQPRLEAELLLGNALERTRMDLYLSFDQPLTTEELGRLRPLVRRRANREPLYWILGSKGFHNIELDCHPDVLVPRSDTESLVEAVLARLPEDFDGFIADVGSGTGAVGLAIAAARPNTKLYATDIAEAAIENTKANVIKLALTDRVAVLRGPLLTAIPERRPIDIVVSNPPYIASDELSQLDPEVAQHEPRLALDGGPDGLATYRLLLKAASQRARVGVAVEIGHTQAPAVTQLMKTCGFIEPIVIQDLGGRDRVVVARQPHAHWPSTPEATSAGLTGARATTQPETTTVLDSVPQDIAVDEEGTPLPVIEWD